MDGQLTTKLKLQAVIATVVIVNVMVCVYYTETVRESLSSVVEYSITMTSLKDHGYNISTIEGLSVCHLNSSNLRNDVSPEQRLEEVERNPSILTSVRPGGVYTPPNCTPKDNVAIIVPFRDRAEHMDIFLRHMHSFLQRQHIAYRIFFIELTYTSQFNRALLMNAGFVYASNITNFSCYIFHDVDLLPTNEFNFYNCSGATHFASNNSKYGYRLLYPTYFGGVVGFSEKSYLAINGCSNLYYGWGNEDDDLMQRVKYKIRNQFQRKPLSTGVYKSLEHVQSDYDEKNLIPRKTLKLSPLLRMNKDGLNSLNVTFVQSEDRELYTWVLIDVDEEYQIQKYKESLLSKI